MSLNLEISFQELTSKERIETIRAAFQKDRHYGIIYIVTKQKLPKCPLRDGFGIFCQWHVVKHT